MAPIAICISACGERHRMGLTQDWCVACRANRSEDAVERLTAQRDALLEALREIADMTQCDAEFNAAETARAAIKAAEAPTCPNRRGTMLGGSGAL